MKLKMPALKENRVGSNIVNYPRKPKPKDQKPTFTMVKAYPAVYNKYEPKTFLSWRVVTMRESRTDIAVIKNDIGHIKEDVKVLKTDVKNISTNVLPDIRTSIGKLGTRFWIIITLLSGILITLVGQFILNIL